MRSPTDSPALTGEPKKLLNELQPGIDYVDPKFYLPPGVPDQIDRLQFLQACERLGIPPTEGPKFEILNLPGGPAQLPGTVPIPPTTMGIAVRSLVFQLPAYDLCADDHRAWLKKARQAWGVFRQEKFGPYLKKCTRNQRFAVQKLGLKPRKRVRLSGSKRVAIPLERRYELAALRYCRKKSWAELQKLYDGVYTVDQIRKMVTKILASLELTPGR